MARTLTHVRLLVTDFPACFRFYRDVMGFAPILGKEDEAYAEFKAGDVILALFPRQMMAEVVGTTDRADTPVPDHLCLCISVDDVDAFYGEVQATGAEMVTAPTDRPDWGIRTAHFRDPAGNLVEINRSLTA